MESVTSSKTLHSLVLRTAKQYHEFMDDKSYQVIFRGKTLSDVEDDRVKDNLAKLFKRDRSSIESLFDGGRKVLKRGLDRETANKYRDVLRKAGALVAVVAEKSQQEAAPASRKASFMTAEEPPETPAAEQAPSPETETADHHSTAAEVQPVESEPEAHPTVVSETESDRVDESDGMSLLPPGTVLVKQQVIEKPEFPDNQMTLDEVGIVMDEVEPVATPDIDISQLDMSADFDGLDDAPKPEAPDINSEFEMSGEGVVLDDVARPEKLVVATEHLSAEAEFDGLDDSDKPDKPEINTDNLGLIE